MVQKYRNRWFEPAQTRLLPKPTQSHDPLTVGSPCLNTSLLIKGDSDFFSAIAFPGKKKRKKKKKKRKKTQSSKSCIMYQKWIIARVVCLIVLRMTKT